MRKPVPFSILISILLLANSCQQHLNDTNKSEKKNSVERRYSKNVNDSFSISISLPNGYDPNGKQHYPIVFLLDANLYFDIMATAINKYSEVGLAPEVILVGVGYKDFITMDSLRTRDYTWPVAIPEYEMTVSGGADKFLRFIKEELSPAIDKEYKTDTANRILMGHSLGGYFVSYALLQGLSGKSKYFNGYISASPSMHYNNYWLLNELKQLPPEKINSRKLKAYFSFGGLEDEDEDDTPGYIKVNELSQQLSKLFADKYALNVDFRSDVYSNLAHMETPIPTFLKGLQLVAGSNNEEGH